MKKILTKSLLVTLMFVAFISYATENPSIKKHKNNTRIVLNDVKKAPFLFIKNTTGKIIHEQLLNITGNGTGEFDFSSLKNGYYTLEINKDFQIDIKPFTVISGEAIFHKKAEKIIFKPVIRTDKNKVLISQLNFDAISIQISIYYEDEIIYTDIVKGAFLIEKIYALQEDKKGNYKIVTKANDRIYIKEFSLK
jgi:hypothetical protein|tara:strand:- start:357 stop:938 length:582 start_codon:yes stop_codon:yes gene_type:complete